MQACGRIDSVGIEFLSEIPKLRRRRPRSRARRRPRNLAVTQTEQNNCPEDRLFHRRRSPTNRGRARGRFPNFGIWVYPRVLAIEASADARECDLLA
jgi:hypothetical protein